MNYCSLAVLNERGEPEVVPDLNGNRYTPSVVAFEGDGSVVLGVEAKNRLTSDSANVVQLLMPEMGNPLHRFNIAGSKYSPVEVLALILRKLKEECVEQGSIEDVVLTVPAHFNEVERKSTMDAGKLAGLNVLGLVNEPTAAALYYASQITISGNIVVYRLGANAFDVTIFRISRDHVEILSSKGHGHLGGVDFDKELARHIVSVARKDLGGELFPDRFFDSMPTDGSDEAAIYFKVMELAERAKKQLSVREVTRANIKLQGRNFKVSVHRQDFEELISSHLSATEMLLENALEDAGLSAHEIDNVVLSGGSTRIPKVREILEQFFGFAPASLINPEDAVTLGAAIMAEKQKLKQDEGTDVSNRENIEAQIARLQQMFDRGQMSQEEVDQKIRKILTGT